jgi:hypothetical protein
MQGVRPCCAHSIVCPIFCRNTKVKLVELWEVEWALSFHTYISYMLLCTVLFYAAATEFLCGIVDSESNIANLYFNM